MAAGDDAGLGELLRRYRLAAGLTQEDLAARSGLSVRTIGSIERGARGTPYSRSLRLLADALGLRGAQRDAMIAATHPGGPPRVLPAAGAPDLVPRQLPPTVRKFVGRDAEMSALESWVPGSRPGTGDTAPVALITGSAGMGKTTLAVQFGHRAAGRFPDGQLYADLRGFGPSGRPVRAAEMISGFLDALGVPAARIPPDEQAQAGLYRTIMAARKVLVILDNASSAEQVLPLLPAGGGCMAVVTSRRRLISVAAGQDACVLPLDVLSADEALELIAWRVGPQHAAREPDALRELAKLSAGLPLALAIIAGRATGPAPDLSGLAAELREARLDALDTGDASMSARQVFSWSYWRLSDQARQAFRMLGLHPGPVISQRTAVSLTGTGDAQARAALAELCRASVVIESQPGRYGCHDVLRAYAADRAQAEDDDVTRRSVVHRALDHYLRSAYSAALAINPARDPFVLPEPLPGVMPENVTGSAAAHAWFATERQTLLAAITVAAEQGFATHAWQLALLLGSFLNNRGRWREWASALRTALAATQSAADIVGEAHTRRELGAVMFLLGSDAEGAADMTAAVSLHERIGDHSGAARAHLHLGAGLDRRGRYREALGHAERALDLFRTVGNKSGQARALNALAWDHAHLGDYDQALDYCQQSLAGHRGLGDLRGEGASWDSLAYIHERLGDQEQALSCYERAVDLYGPADDHFNHAEALTKLGDGYAAAGRPGAAREAWQRALGLLDGVDDQVVSGLKARLSRQARTMEL